MSVSLLHWGEAGAVEDGGRDSVRDDGGRDSTAGSLTIHRTAPFSRALSSVMITDNNSLERAIL